MNTRKRILILAILATVAAAGVAPSFAARAIQGTVGEVSAACGAALGTVGFRIWSALPGGTTLIVNNNVVSCRGVRCLRTYVTNTTLNPGGFVGNQEATQVYNGDLPDQPFYELADAKINDGAGNDIGYYGVSGVAANNAGIGNFLAAGCAGATATNCFGRIDSSVAVAPIKTCKLSFLGPCGGLNPIPVVNVVAGGTCPSGMVCLHWNDPATYASAMRGSTTSGPPPSPVKGVRLFKIFKADCSKPAGNDPEWLPVGDFPLGAGAGNLQDPLPVPTVGCNYYALAVRLVGPGGDPNPEILTTFLGVPSCGVGSTPTAVRIVRFDARYAGHGVVNVSWQSGVEGDVQGFRITRSPSATGPYQVVSELFRAQGDNHRYQGTDHVSAAARSYYYQLQIIGRDGSVSTSSPAGVTVTARPRKAGPAIR